MDEEKTKLSAEIMREIEILRSERKIETITAESGRDVPAFAALRKMLTKDQRDVINTIWRYYLEHQEWIPTRILHHEMKKEFVLSAIGPLGGKCCL